MLQYSFKIILLSLFLILAGKSDGFAADLHTSKTTIKSSPAFRINQVGKDKSHVQFLHASGPIRLVHRLAKSSFLMIPISTGKFEFSCPIAVLKITTQITNSVQTIRLFQLLFPAHFFW